VDGVKPRIVLKFASGERLDFSLSLFAWLAHVDLCSHGIVKDLGSKFHPIVGLHQSQRRALGSSLQLARPILK
jgi:hypothetical protein